MSKAHWLDKLADILGYRVEDIELTARLRRESFAALKEYKETAR